MAKVLRVIAVVAGAVALVATGVGAVIGTATAAAAAASATASTIATIATLVAGVAGIGAQLLTKPPPARGSVTETIIEVDPPSPYLMGEGYFAGVMRHRVGYGPTLKKVPNPYLWEVMALCVAGPIAGPIIPQVDFGAVSSYYSGWLATDTRLGARPDTSLVPQLYGPAPGWGGASHLSSVAAIGWNYRFDKDGKVFASGLPTRGAIAKWVLVYDPRKDSTRPGGSGSHRLGDESTYEWSENPALHAGTYAFGRYVNGQRVMGVGLPEEGIDWEGVAAWANDCEANGWRMFGAVFEGAPDDETRRWANLREICVAGGAEPLFSGAVLGFHWQRPRVALDTIYTSDLADAAQDVTAMQSWRDRLNTVRPRYTSPEHNWELVQAEAVQIPAYVEDDGQIRAEDIPFNFVKDKDQAAQLAAYWLVNSREITPITLTVMPRLRAYRPGECLHLALPDLGLDHDAIILRRKFDPATMTVELTLVTEDPAKHDFALGRVGVAPPAPSLTNTAEGRDNITRAARAPYWPEVDGPGRPEDGATRGAPIGTEVAGLPAEDLVEQAAQTAALADTTADAVAEAQQDIADLFATYGSTASAASSAAAAAASQSAAAAAASTAATASSVAQSARDNAQAARDQAQAARDLAQSYQTGAQAAQSAAQTASSAASSARSAAEAAQGAATTQASNAAASASAANTSASNASSSASAASSSASAASASATQAASQASQAGVYASQAATSATDAAGHSSSAFSSSQVAAGARDVTRDVLARLLPPALDPQSRSAYNTDRFTSIDGPAQTAWGWPQAYLAFAPSSAFSPYVYPRLGIPTVVGRRYRAVCWTWIDAHTPGTIGVGGWVNGTTVPETLNWVNLSPASLVAPAGAVTGTISPAPQTFIKLGLEYTVEDGWPAFHRPMFNVYSTSGWEHPIGANAYLSGIVLEDITSEYAAAQSAAASATSASSAAASQNAAGQSASAAQTSATNASTSAGQAATSAGQASTSASNAITSASSASTSASNAAGSASTAATQANNAANSASAAAGSASAASGSASTAATHATNADVSATSAQNSATSASTSASGAAGSANSAFGSANDAAGSANSAFGSAASASTSAGQASTSASNAAGSASSAATSASLSASARDGATQALQTTFPQYLSPETQAAYTTDGLTALWGPSTDWPVPYITYTAPNTSASPANYFKKGIAAIPGKRYRVMAWFYSSASNNPYYNVWIGGSTTADSWGVSGQFGGFGSVLDPAIPTGCSNAAQTGPLPQNTFFKAGFEFTIPNDPDWGYWRPIFQVLGNVNASQALNNNTHLTGITVEDITSEAASKGFAAASASSASSAAASQSAAANSASASQTSALNAATSAGTAGTHASNAGTSASNAASSASNAAGSAATASQQATIASQAATNAANSASAAAGSASTASTQAGLAGQSASAAASAQVSAESSATGALAAFGATFPADLDPQGRRTYRTDNYNGDFRQAQPEWGWPRNFMVVRGANQVAGLYVFHASGMPTVPGRRYRVTAWAFTYGTNAVGSLWLAGTPTPEWANVTGLTPDNLVGLPSGGYNPVAQSQFVKFSFEYTVPASGWPAYHRPAFAMEGQGGALLNGETYQSGILIEDVTSEAAAASSASAAATSASTASTAAGSAGSSATSATNAANTASTAAGNASSSASAASGSSASAASSASTAGTHAANALTYSNQSASFRDQAQSSASNAAASASAASASESSAANSATLSAQFQGAANLLTNTDFAVDLSGWEAAALSGANTTWSRNLAGDDWRPIPENSFGLYQNGRVGTGDATGQIVQRVPVEPGQILQVSAWIAAHRCDVNVGIAFQDANFQWIAGWTFTNLARASGGQSLSSWTRIGVTTGAAPSNARYAAFHLYKYDTDAGQTDSYAWMARPQISFARAGQTLLNHFTPGSGRATAATFSAGLLAEESARASAIASEASARTALAATVSSQGSTITQQASVIATLQSQAATFEQRLVAGTTNYLRNGSFELGNFTFWTPGGVSGGFAVDQGSIWGNYAYYSHPTGASGFPFLMQDIAWPEQHWLTASASLNAWSTSGDVVTYLEVMWLNASGVEIGSRSYSPQVANAWFGSTDNRRGHTVTGLAPVGTVRARVLCVAHSPSGTLRFFGVRQVKAEVGTTATPYSNEATVNYQAGVIADHDGKLQAYLQKGVSAGAAAAWIKMIAKDVNGNPTSSIGMEAQEIVMTNSVGNLKRVAMRLADGNATFGGDVIFGGRLLFANGLALRLAVQPWVIQVHDGQSITYPNAGYLPAAAFQPTGLSPLGSGETYSLYLENQTASGATVRLKINVPGVPANFNLTSDYAGGSPQRAIFKGTNPDAIGNSYRMIATYTSGANAVLEGVNYWVAYFSISLEVYAYVGSNWVVIGSFFTVDQQSYSDGGYKEITGTMDVEVTAPSGVTHFGASGLGATVVNQITSLSWTAPGTPGSVRSASPNGEKCQLTLNY